MGDSDFIFCDRQVAEKSDDRIYKEIPQPGCESERTCIKSELSWKNNVSDAEVRAEQRKSRCDDIRCL